MSFKGCRPLTKEEEEKINEMFKNKENFLTQNKGTRYDALHWRDKAYYVCGIKSGFRASELSSITVGNVYDFKANKIKDILNVSKDNMKGKTKNRAVPIAQLAKEAIAQLIENWEKIHMRQITPNDYLFQGIHKTNRRYNYTSGAKMLKRLFSKAGIEDVNRLSNHSMRKTLAKKAYEISSKDIIFVQKVLGHSNVTSTQQYIQCDNELLGKMFE